MSTRLRRPRLASLPRPLSPPTRAALEAARVLWGTQAAYLLNRSRAATLSERRQAVWAALRRANMPYAAIAAAFGRDHATVAYGVRVAERRAMQDATYAAAIATIVEEVQHGDQG